MMDYKYIEQLLERYWECNTNLEEEKILQAFFSQEDVPAAFAQYVPLFSYQNSARQEHLGEDFDQRIEAIIEAEMPQTVHRTKARVITMRKRFAPFAKAAATVAVILTIGSAAERAVMDNTHDDTEVTTPIIADTYVRSEDVASVVSPTPSAQRITEGGATAQNTDTIATPSVTAELPSATE